MSLWAILCSVRGAYRARRETRKSERERRALRARAKAMGDGGADLEACPPALHFDLTTRLYDGTLLHSGELQLLSRCPTALPAQRCRSSHHPRYLRADLVRLQPKLQVPAREEDGSWVFFGGAFKTFFISGDKEHFTSRQVSQLPLSTSFIPRSKSRSCSRV
jgi:hypothetical protein